METAVGLYVAHMGWGYVVGIFFLIREVRGETDESEARQRCKGSDGMQNLRLQAEPTVPYHLVTRLGKGAWSRQKTDFCTAPFFVGAASRRWRPGICARRRRKEEEGVLYRGMDGLGIAVYEPDPGSLQAGFDPIRRHFRPGPLREYAQPRLPRISHRQFAGTDEPWLDRDVILRRHPE